MTTPERGRGLALAALGLVALGLGGLALWLTTREEAPSRVPEPTREDIAALAEPVEARYMAVPSEAEAGPLPAKLAAQRETSNRMRGEILAALALRSREGVSARAGDPAHAPDEPAQDQPALDKDYIRERIREDLIPVAVECYESVLEDEPEAGGKIVMKFAILGDPEVGGVVDEATVDPEQTTFANAALHECMRESLMAVNFEAPPEGGRVDVTYPFEFAPD